MVRWPSFFKHAHVLHHSVRDSVEDTGASRRGQTLLGHGQDAAVITLLMCGNVRAKVLLAQYVYTLCVFAHVKPI